MSSEPPALLDLRGLRVRLGGAEVLRGASLAVRPGEFVGLIGPNGAGKSTLMRAALGLVPAVGDIRLGGQPLAGLSPPERAARAAYLPQGREIAWPVSVEVLVGLGRPPAPARGTAEREADRQAVAAAMARMDVSHLARRPAVDLSGGEQARVLIARALAQEAPMLVADEPAAGLDPAHQIDLMATLAGLARGGSGVLASLHDLGLAARWCDRLVLLAGGRVVAEGPPAAVLTPERLAEVYAVRAFITQADGMVLLPVARA